jgi:NADP-dependent 3-hydroxy acid dehydrogenase YdfG
MSALAGRAVAVTGASSGIGAATAYACARAGAAVAVCARRTERLDGLVERINGEGGRAVAFETDISDEQQCWDFVDGAVRELGGLDVLVNNAGVMHLGPIDGAPTDEWRRMVNVNVLGLLYCTQAAIPHLRRSEAGHIANVSSVGGRVVGPWSGVYSATKFAVGAISEALRRELMDDGIRVTVIEPGRVESELRTHVRPEVLEQLGGGFAEITPIAADELADTIVWALAQPKNVSVSELLVRPLISPL